MLHAFLEGAYEDQCFVIRTDLYFEYNSIVNYVR